MMNNQRKLEKAREVQSETQPCYCPHRKAEVQKGDSPQAM